jgi:hypothetical protein
VKQERWDGGSGMGGRAGEVGREVERGRGGNLGVIFPLFFFFLETFFHFLYSQVSRISSVFFGNIFVFFGPQLREI